MQSSSRNSLPACLGYALGLSLWLSLALSLPTLPAHAQSVPTLMNFQGRLAKPDGTPVADTNSQQLTFRLYTALTGGTRLWQQTSNNVSVHNGTFTVLLNFSTGFQSGNTLTTAFNNTPYLEVQVGNNAPLTPRQQLVSVAYAMKANTVPDGSITADKFASDIFNPLAWLLGGNRGTNPSSHFLGTTDSQPLIFRTNNAERIRLLADGKLGLGTSNPAQQLDVRGSVQVQNTLRLDGADEPMVVREWDPFTGGAKQGFGRWGLYMEPATLFLGVAGTDYGGTSRLTLGGWLADSTREDWLTVLQGGNVGIGTNDPAATLHVLSNMGSGQALDGGIVFQHTNQTQGIGFGYNTIYATGTNGSQDLGLQSRGTGALRLNPNGGNTIIGGNVGIGTGSPAAKLHLSGGNLRVDEGEIQSWGPIVLHPDVDNSGDDVVQFLNSAGSETMRINSNGNVGIGTSNPGVKLDVVGTVQARVVRIIGGSDVAEPFHVRRAGLSPIKPGLVVAIDEKRVGELRLSTRPYDRAVAGIISGAGGVRPGLTLTQTGTAADGTHPVAMTGRVWCWVDADKGGPVRPGDLLTTSSTPGHAMRVGNYPKAQGAVLGKAMSSLKRGKGLVLVLVRPQ